MGQSLGVCFGRTLVVYDVKNCDNPGEISEDSRVREDYENPLSIEDEVAACLSWLFIVRTGGFGGILCRIYFCAL